MELKKLMHGAGLAIAMLSACIAQAQDLSGRKSVVLTNAAQERVVVGHVDFTPVPNGRTRFRFTLDASKFGEYFLAMRPFKCLNGATQRLCHFPYGNDDEIGPGDWTALEYQLMFLRTAPGAPHLNPRNGVYYRLEAGARGLQGKVFEVDMDPIITPQGDRRRPITAKQLEATDAATHWLPQLNIE
jgi:hypothetical protein